MEEDDSLILECSDGFVPTTCSLASRLEFFKVMLRLDVKEAKEKVCQLKDYNKEQVGTLLDVLARTQAKELSVEKLLDVVPLAHYLNAKEVQNAAADKINDLVRNSNFGDVIENFNVYVDLAVQFNSEQLKDACRKYWISERQGRRCATFTTSQKICTSCNYCHFCGRHAYTFGPKSACYANCSELSGLKLVDLYGYLSALPDDLIRRLAKYDISLVEELFPNVRVIQHSNFLEPLLQSCDLEDVSDQQLLEILSLDLRRLVEFFKRNSNASSKTILHLAERSVVKDETCAKMLGLCLSPELLYVNAAQRLIEKCGAFNDKAFNTECLNPLHLACKWDQGHLVEYVVENGANVNCLTNDNANFTALHIASSFNSCKAVEALLKFKPSLNEICFRGNTPLAIAVKSNNFKIVEMLVNAKADLNIGDRYKVYPIHAAVENGNAEIVQLLVKGKANLDVVNGSGETALHIAVSQERIDFAKIIVEGGANLDTLNDNGDTALHIATRKGFIEIVKVLVEGRANLDLKNNSKDTALHIAISKSFEIVKLLVKAGAVLGVPNSSGETALHLAVNQQNTDLVKLLEEAGVNLDLLNDNGDTALHIATKKGLLEIVKVLVEAGANRNVSDANKQTACSIAMQSNRKDIVDVLLQKPCNLQ